MIKRIISIILSVVLFIGLLPNKAVWANDSVDEIQPNEYRDDIDIVENNSEEIVAETNVSTVDEDITVSASWDKINNEFIITSVEKDSEGNELVKEYEVELKEASEDKIVAVFKDTETNEEFVVNSNEAHASMAFLAPIGVVIGEALLSHLIAASAAVVIAGVTYTVASKVASKLRNKSYDHYAAVIRKGDVYIGNPISYSAAVARMKSGGDVWSKSYSLAAKVARGAGNGRTPVGPERHGNGKPGYYWHFHTYNRSGGHSFY